MQANAVKHNIEHMSELVYKYKQILKSLHAGEKNFMKDYAEVDPHNKDNFPETSANALEWVKGAGGQGGLSQEGLQQFHAEIMDHGGGAVHERIQTAHGMDAVHQQLRHQLNPTNAYGLAPGEHAGPLHVLGHAHHFLPQNSWMHHDETQVRFS